MVVNNRIDAVAYWMVYPITCINEDVGMITKELMIKGLRYYIDNDKSVIKAWHTVANDSLLKSLGFTKE